MEKTAIKNFAIEARKILMRSAIAQAGFYGVTKEGCSEPIQRGAGFEVYMTVAGTENRIYGEDLNRRRKLVQEVQKIGFDQVIEKTAYTWFNRLIAIRFMEVNDYLPTRTRVLSSETGSKTPDLVTQYLDVELNLKDEELQKIQSSIRNNKYDEAFVLLFIKQCNELNRVLPKLFEKTDDYMELLLKISYINDGVVRMLVDTIPEQYFNVKKEGQVEIIGWMYQYYNTEPKSEAFAKKGKITKKEIPAITQLFTPDWIVRYMVENSLGRLWVEGHPDTMELLKDNWKYYLEEAEQEPEVQTKLAKIKMEYAKLNPEDITFMDCCMGSGHILVYAFDVFMQIYESMGYSRRNAVQQILVNNLHGLDIDDRAAQLSYFAVMMKVLEYDKRFFNREYQPQPNVYAIQESNGINRAQLNYFGSDLSTGEKKEALDQMTKLLDTFVDSKEYGSILKVEQYDWDLLRRFADDIDTDGQLSIDTYGLSDTVDQINELIAIAEVMSQKYWVTSTNPPYASLSNLDTNISNYVKKRYPDSKPDLYAVFIEKCSMMTVKLGFQAMITQHSWMYLSSFQKLREKVLHIDVINMAHLGARAFDDIGGEVVQTTSFVLRKSFLRNYVSRFSRLVECNSSAAKKELFLAGENNYSKKQDSFGTIPGMPFAYWLSDAMIKVFEFPPLSDIGETREGVTTANNDLFLKLWFEVNINDICMSCKSHKESEYLEEKWYPHHKGGEYRKWYGNCEYVIYWHHGAKAIRNYKDEETGRIRSHNYNIDYNFREYATWSRISAENVGMRYSPSGFVFDSASAGLFLPKDVLKYGMGFICSKVAKPLLLVLNPTIKIQPGDVANLPFVIKKEFIQIVNEYVDKNIEISKSEWDSFEISWDFKEHPLVWWSKRLWDATNIAGTMSYYYGELPEVRCPLELCYLLWQGQCNERFKHLKANEKELNRIFIDIYSLQDELNPDVEEKDVTVRKADLKRDIKSLISYAVGCMFGRYSLDEEGLAFAGGEWDDSKYRTFIPDSDNCIPITDEEYFEDDIVGRFCEFLKVVFGEESFEDNLNFVAQALGNKGNNSRDVIRNYFLNDFFKDHCSTYSVSGSGKRPIYWLFDSGKENGFKCLIYMHRYNRDTVGRIRSEYLKKSQDAIEGALKNAEYAINNSESAVDRAAATRKRDKYIKQLNETRIYYQALSHVALQRIEIDLDDGVKKNYAKFQNIEVVAENGKKQKVNLLAKI